MSTNGGWPPFISENGFYELGTMDCIRSSVYMYMCVCGLAGVRASM